MTMKHALTAAAGLAFAASAQAGSFSQTFDFSNEVFDGDPNGQAAAGNPFTISSPAGPVTGIDWDITYTGGDAVGTLSWASEMSVELISPGATNGGPGDAMPSGSGGSFPSSGNPGTIVWGSNDSWSPAGSWDIDLGFPEDSGTHSSSGSTDLLDGVDAGGDWEIWFYDTFDDGAQGAFGNATITVHYVPTPGAAALFGLAGLGAVRRRRR